MYGVYGVYMPRVSPKNRTPLIPSKTFRNIYIDLGLCGKKWTRLGGDSKTRKQAPPMYTPYTLYTPHL